MFSWLTRRVLEPPAIGLDISDLSVKFVRVRHEGSRLAIDAFGEVAIPPGIVVDGEVKREADLTSVLKAELRDQRGRSLNERFCVAALPEEKSFVRVLELPKLAAQDLGLAVRWEVEGAVPLRFDEIYYDYELIASRRPPPAPPDHQDVLLTAFPRAVIASYERAISAAGLRLTALELESQAICRAVISDALLGDSLLLIDIGAVRSSFIIFAGSTLVFTKSIPLGGRDIEATIAKELGVSLEEARAIKVEHGFDAGYENGRLTSALSPLLVTLVTELGLELAFYRDHPRTKHAELPDISAVYLCGGDANLAGLAEYLAAAVRKDVRIADPLVKLPAAPGVVPPIPKNQALQYATAIGLALRAVGY